MLNKEKYNVPQRFLDHPLFNEKIMGMNFGFLCKRGFYDTDYAKAQPAEMAKMGVNWTTLNANLCMENFHTPRVFLDFEYSSGEQELIDMAKRLHDNGVRVLFKPCLTPLDGAHMGAMSWPRDNDKTQIAGLVLDNWKRFFHSYGESMKYFGDLAEKMGAETMLVGAENFGLEQWSDHWRTVIQGVRETYSGPISYEFVPKSIDANSLDWFEDLDYLSYSYYVPARPRNRAKNDYVNPMAPNTPVQTVDAMVEYLSSRPAVIDWICEHFGSKPIVFTEMGCRSARGVTQAPQNFRWESWYDGDEQANYMEACMRTFWDMENYLGMFWWKWDERQYRAHYHADPAGEMGFTIQGKPAEQVFKRWAAKAREENTFGK